MILPEGQSAEPAPEQITRHSPCGYFAGANSIFYGDKLLTAANPRANEDLQLLRELGLAPQAPNPELEAPEADDSRPLYPACGAGVGCGV